MVTVKREHRYCKICGSQKVEDETHFVIACEGLNETRELHINPQLRESPETNDMSDVEKLKWLLDRENIKRSAEGIEALFKTRQSMTFKKPGGATIH